MQQDVGFSARGNNQLAGDPLSIRKAYSPRSHDHFSTLAIRRRRPTLTMARTVKVAIVGSGLAGLTAAYRLTETPCLGDVEFEVHIFEKVRGSSSFLYVAQDGPLALPRCYAVGVTDFILPAGAKVPAAQEHEFNLESCALS